jgi:hypothetical protein
MTSTQSNQHWHEYLLHDKRTNHNSLFHKKSLTFCSPSLSFSSGEQKAVFPKKCLVVKAPSCILYSGNFPSLARPLGPCLHYSSGLAIIILKNWPSAKDRICSNWKRNLRALEDECVVSASAVERVRSDVLRRMFS